LKPYGASNCVHAQKAQHQQVSSGVLQTSGRPRTAHAPERSYAAALRAGAPWQRDGCHAAALGAAASENGPATCSGRRSPLPPSHRMPRAGRRAPLLQRRSPLSIIKHPRITIMMRSGAADWWPTKSFQSRPHQMRSRTKTQDTRQRPWRDWHWRPSSAACSRFDDAPPRRAPLHSHAAEIRASARPPGASRGLLGPGGCTIAPGPGVASRARKEQGGGGRGLTVLRVCARELCSDILSHAPRRCPLASPLRCLRACSALGVL